MTEDACGCLRPGGMLLEDWPAIDRDAWDAALTPGADLLDVQGPGAHWSAGTRRGTRYAYGQWLGWLAAHDPGVLNRDPAARLTGETVAAYVADLRPRLSPSGLWNAIKHLYDAIRVLAPSNDWIWLRDCAQRLSRGLQPAHKADRMVTADRVKALGFDLMCKAWSRIDALDSPTRADLLAYRDGLIVALLACRPIRRRNLAMMRLDRHMLRAGDHWRLDFTAEETKNHQPIDVPLPADLAPWLDRWVDQVRPRFPGATGHDGVWPSSKGVPLQAEGLNDLVKRRTKAAFGKSIHLHLFRDIAATTIALEAPAQVRASRDLLGHGDLRTTERHYIQANGIAASRRYGAILDRIRAGERPPR